MIGKLFTKLTGIREAFSTVKKASPETIEDVLLQADVGVRYTSAILQKILKQKDDAQAVLKDEMIRLLSLPKPVMAGPPPHIIMVSGVNGSGKTTTAAKLANLYTQRGTVLMASGDTYRDAAYEQLGTWARRIGVEIVGSQKGQDAAAVVFDALAKATSKKIEYVIVDTAGRLHTRTDLMEELKKIMRVIVKFKDEGPDYNLLTVDSTLGQNSIQQARIFTEGIDLNGLILTKYDGTAKGGAIIPISNELRLPVLYLGIGEGVDDIVEFDPEDFVHALFE
ncbi:MAG: signal recognition particle-docking protein FtsY [candidate division WOR-3 bacterium]|nr:MAG: signal recognition particle-docking protein FtsY [candidate division WOR-3 bacterium]